VLIPARLLSGHDAWDPAAIFITPLRKRGESVKTLFVGIDVSMKDFKAQFMDNLGETVSKR